jgi:carboxyl-terminal processing protease
VLTFGAVRRRWLIGPCAGLLAWAGWLLLAPPGPSPGLAPCEPSAASALSPAASAPAACVPAETTPGRTLQAPSGAPASLSCDEARKIIRQARGQLAAPPAPPELRPFSDALVDWVDPHGLWTAAPDSPVAAALRAHARAVIAEIEAPPGSGPCAATHELGTVLSVWVGELRSLFEAAEGAAPTMTPEQAFRFASLAAFEDGPVTRPARSLATELGYRAGVVRRSLGVEGAQAAEAVRERLLPGDTMDWSAVILAGAVRAYLPQIDPHGGWAPLDEETSLYEIDLEASPPPRLWRKMTRTAVGVRVEETHVEGLAQGDVVLRVGDTATAGLSVEQCEQLSLVDVDGMAPLVKRIAVLSAGDAAPRVIDVRPASRPREEPGSSDPAQPDEPALEAARVPYGDGEVLVVPFGDVPDNLGEELGATLRRERGPALLGVVLDLRGNGGGSTDGAAGALALFLPGTPLFPMKRRDGTVEVERSPLPPLADRWDGPVAALVDGDTASAAEMISGALLAYRRGPVLGDRTYGKGCAQEYLDDDARAGVLRLTTLLYALPDGTPVQMTGLAPTLRLPMPRAPEREANLAHALGPWRGPDVREAPLVREVPWPGHGGAVGPCKDATLCRALRSLGAPRAATARERR